VVTLFLKIFSVAFAAVSQYPVIVDEQGVFATEQGVFGADQGVFGTQPAYASQVGDLVYDTGCCT